MKKSKAIQLVLITAALASCQDKKPVEDWGDDSKTYVRSDSTAPYTRTHHHHGIGNALLWYYAFRPVGVMRNGAYERNGYYSGAIPHRSNVGNNFTKNTIPRGGFGRSGIRASS